MLVALAEFIARTAHAGQREQATGEPYTTHLARVVAQVTGDDEQSVAWLHDVLEDTGVTVGDLQEAGVPTHILAAVILLTRNGQGTYAQYIDIIKSTGNPLAIAVKVADLKDHLRPETQDWLNESRRKRYQQALDKLSK